MRRVAGDPRLSWLRAERAADHAFGRLTSPEELMTLANLFLEYGVPEQIRSDSGPELVAAAVRGWLSDLGVTTLFMEPGSPGRAATSNRSTARSVTSC